MDMGFSEDEILIALENCHHNFEAAAAWLLGDHVTLNSPPSKGRHRALGIFLL